MPFSEETIKILREKGREDLIKIGEINDSGYAGINKVGQIVDRRECPEAVPVQENRLLGIPKPKALPKNLEIGEFSGAELLAKFDEGWKIINSQTGQQYTRAELIADLKATGAL